MLETVDTGSRRACQRIDVARAIVVAGGPAWTQGDVLACVRPRYDALPTLTLTRQKGGTMPDSRPNSSGNLSDSHDDALTPLPQRGSRVTMSVRCGTSATPAISKGLQSATRERLKIPMRATKSSDRSRRTGQLWHTTA